jgi:hypothetical protein
MVPIPTFEITIANYRYHPMSKRSELITTVIVQRAAKAKWFDSGFPQHESSRQAFSGDAMDALRHGVTYWVLCFGVEEGQVPSVMLDWKGEDVSDTTLCQDNLGSCRIDFEFAS